MAKINLKQRATTKPLHCVINDAKCKDANNHEQSIKVDHRSFLVYMRYTRAINVPSQGVSCLPPGGCYGHSKIRLFRTWHPLNKTKYTRKQKQTNKNKQTLTFMHVQHKSMEMNPLFLFCLNVWIEHVHHHRFSCAWFKKEQNVTASLKKKV